MNRTIWKRADEIEKVLMDMRMPGSVFPDNEQGWEKIAGFLNDSMNGLLAEVYRLNARGRTQSTK